MSLFAFLVAGALANEPIETERMIFDPVISGGTTDLRDPLVFQGVAYLTSDPLVSDALTYVEAAVINDAKIDWFVMCDQGECLVEIGEATECATYDHPDGTIVVCE